MKLDVKVVGEVSVRTLKTPRVNPIACDDVNASTHLRRPKPPRIPIWCEKLG